MTDKIDPSRTALLLMDFQPAIMGGIEGQEGLLARAASAKAVAKSAGCAVIYIRVAFEPSDFASIPARNKALAGLQKGGFLEADSEAASIHPILAPEEDDVVLRKTRYGPFGTTALASHLAGRDIDTLVLAGVSTSGVVLSTIRDAADRDFRLLVLSDCVADHNSAAHEALIQHVFPVQADVIASDELPALLA